MPKIAALRPVTRALLQAPGRLYDWDLGWLLGHRFLRLTHQGRRSGKQYRTMLEVLGIDRGRNEYFVLAGRGRNADWYRNIQDSPATEVAVGRLRFAPEHRVLDNAEAAGVLADYERRNKIAARLVRKVLSTLAGWHYDGSDQARCRLVTELPIVGLKPNK